MKWTSANSSDRKSVFYTSEDIKEQRQQPQKSKGNGSVTDSNSSSLFTFKMGGDEETTTESQNSKSSSSSNSIERHNGSTNSGNGADLKRYLKNFMLFSNLEIESEKKCRDEQLSRVVKALMLFEKKLRREQEIIQQQLCEKDRVINRQKHTISNMKVRLGAEHQLNDDATTNITTTTITSNETSEFCPMCRKKYYLRASKSIATQTSLKGFANSISDDYSSIQSVEYMSSSEEQEALQSPNPFSTARRSKKYTSKKSYKEYLQSRPHHSNSSSSASTNGESTRSHHNATPKDHFLVSDRNNNTIEHTTATATTAAGTSNGSGKEIGISKSASCGGAAKFSLIMNDIHGIKQQKQQSCDDTHSLKINRMHGISLTTLNTTVNEMKEKDTLAHHNSGDDSSCNNNHHHHAGDNQTAIKVTVVGDDKAELNGCSEDAATRKKYCDEGLNVKQKIATRDDWYISDIEENDTLGGSKSPYGNGVSNSVLECVNQILLQQSMDEYIESSKTKPKESITATGTTAPTRSNKRVHFSTKNSMVQIKPRHRHHSPPCSDLMHDDDVLNSTYENQSTYSNEYELIGSSSRSYVDMDVTKSESFKPKLPPKPDNLMKLQQIAKQRAFVQDQIYSKKNNSDYELNESEPDYASISEIQDTITSVKVVTAEVHNSADDDEGNSDDDDDGSSSSGAGSCSDDNEYSEIKEVPTPTPSINDSVSVTVTEDDSFADVPKLPNVYSIIPGIETAPMSPTKKESPGNKCIIGHDNYITKSPMKKKPPIAFASIKKEKEKATATAVNVLTEINNVNKKLSPQQQQPPPVPLKHQQTIKIIDEKIQQEFDWYNLDAEYTKTDIVITPQIENIEEMYQFDDENAMNGDDAVVKVEYNLEDFEYETVPSSSDCSANGIEIETNNNNFTTVIKINESEVPVSPVGKGSTTATTANLMELAETPKIDFKKSNKIRYEKFLKESGLISKPILSSKKKFYAAGSFV